MLHSILSNADLKGVGCGIKSLKGNLKKKTEQKTTTKQNNVHSETVTTFFVETVSFTFLIFFYDIDQRQEFNTLRSSGQSQMSLSLVPI